MNEEEDVELGQPLLRKSKLPGAMQFTDDDDNDEESLAAALNKKKKKYDYKKESGDLLQDYLLESQKRLPEPQLLKRKRDTRAVVCCLAWCAPMPFFINFPMVIFLFFVAVLLAVTTVFVLLSWASVGNYLIANCPVWTWGAFFLLEIMVFFILWGFFFSVRYAINRHHYRYLKLMFSLHGVYSPLTLLLWSALSFANYRLLEVWLVDPLVITWMARALWTIFTLASFWLLWEVSRRYLIVAIERDKLWERLALIFWKERLLRELILAADGDFVPGIRQHEFQREITRSIRYHPKADDMLTLDEWEMWRGKVFDDDDYNVDVPRILLANSEEDKRHARVCRLAVHASQYVFRRLDTSRDGTISRNELERHFGAKGAKEHLSLWDADNDGVLERREMIDVVLGILEDRERLKRILNGRNSLGSILGLTLGVIYLFICLIIALQIFTINVVDLILPFLGIILPVAFIFGNSLRILFESFMVVFIIQPWFPGDFVEMNGFPSMAVSEVHLYTTMGYTVKGVYTVMPNAPALSTWVKNYGRSTNTRIRLYFKIRVAEDDIEAVLDRLTTLLRGWMDERRHIYKRNSLIVWLENSGYATGNYHDVHTNMVALNCQLTELGFAQYDEMNQARKLFIQALKRAIRQVGAKGAANEMFEIVLDASSKLKPKLWSANEDEKLDAE